MGMVWYYKPEQPKKEEPKPVKAEAPVEEKVAEVKKPAKKSKK